MESKHGPETKSSHKQMRSDFSEERAGKMVFPSCAEEQSKDILGKRRELPGTQLGAIRHPPTAVAWRVQPHVFRDSQRNQEKVTKGKTSVFLNAYNRIRLLHSPSWVMVFGFSWLDPLLDPSSIQEDLLNLIYLESLKGLPLPPG